MYVRLRKNKTGSTTVYLIDSIRVVGKKHSVSKVVKCFGSSSDQEQIDTMSLEANNLKSKLESAFISSKSFTNIKESADIESCVVSEYGIRYLYEKISQSFFAKINLSESCKQTLKDVVLMRIEQPMSKLKSALLAADFGAQNLTTNKIYKMMDALNDQKIESIKKIVFNSTQDLLGSSIKVMFYDLTTIYFESNEKSDLKEFGFSKDGKSQHVQISLALIVTESGLPVGYEIFKGNNFEGATLIPTLQLLKDKYKTSNVTIVADSAMLSKANIDALIENEFKFIVSARIKNLSSKITKEILLEDGYIGDDNFSYKSIMIDKNKTLISVFSRDRKSKDEYDREKLLEKIRRFEGKTSKTCLSSRLKKPFVKLSNDSTIEIDYEAMESSKKLDGYFGFITNTNLSEEEVIVQYKGLWQVEQSFRITKHNLKIRPVYHFVDRRIKAHFAICYLSFALIRNLEFKLKARNAYIPIEQLHELLRKIKLITLSASGLKSSIITDIPSEIRTILNILGIGMPIRYKPICRV